MCHLAQCPQCGMYTWGGCGRHVAQIMGQIPPEQRCQCPVQGRVAAAQAAAQAQPRSNGRPPLPPGYLKR